MPKILSYNHKRQIKFANISIYFPLGFLLSSQGVITLQLISHYHVPIANVKYLDVIYGAGLIAASLILSTRVFNFKYKTTIIIGACIQTIACLIFIDQPSFVTSCILFFTIGTGLALIKNSVYSITSKISKTQSEHASFLLTLEAAAWVAQLSAFWMFKHYITAGHWLSTFKVCCVLFTIGSLIVLKTSFTSLIKGTHPDQNSCSEKEAPQAHTSYIDFLKIPRILTVSIALIFYEGIEVGLSTWLPTLDHRLLHISLAQSVATGGLFAVGIILGRIISAIAIQHTHWKRILKTCTIALITLLAILSVSIRYLPLSSHILSHWNQLPWPFYLTPAIGLFLAPIYPILHSVAIAGQPSYTQRSLNALLVIFDTMGNSLCPFSIGYIYQSFGGLAALTTPLVLALPLLMLIIVLNNIGHQKPSPMRDTHIEFT